MKYSVSSASDFPAVFWVFEDDVPLMWFNSYKNAETVRKVLTTDRNETLENEENR